jgi:hypothetical protein
MSRRIETWKVHVEGGRWNGYSTVLASKPSQAMDLFMASAGDVP